VTALLNFHDAVEMFLVLGLQQHNLYSERRMYQFHEYWSELAAVDITVTHKGPLAAFSRARASLKHHATLPSPDTIDDATVHVRDFLKENTPLVFGLDFATVSWASAVSFERVRSFLEQADGLMLESKHREAMGKIAFAFSCLLLEYEASHPAAPTWFFPQDLGLRSWRRRGGPDIPDLLARTIDDFAKNVGERLDALEDSIKIVGVRIDYEKYRRFVDLAPLVSRDGSRDPARWEVVTFARRRANARAVSLLLRFRDR